jgi:hypothetical protein
MPRSKSFPTCSFIHSTESGPLFSHRLLAIGIASQKIKDKPYLSNERDGTDSAVEKFKSPRFVYDSHEL